MTATPPVAARSGLGYLPGIDGLRAVSVLAVLAYHLDAPWSAGGYLGVEVFFVVSGFLITTLLLAEHRRDGRVDVVAFWRRRARRLLPAVVVLVVVVSAWGAVVLPEAELRLFRGDALASLLYVQNWHAVVADQPYFAVFGRPSPLQHLWSLAIEEQFYLLWPLLLPAGLRRLGARGTAAATGLAVVASALAMGATADIAAPARAYYGTDTRAFGLLAGALLAWVWRPSRARADVVAPARWTVDLVGGAALLLLVQQFVVRSEFDPWTFPWGFVWVDALTLATIVSVTHPASRLAGAVGARPLQILGRRSYSLYLWHWPVLVFTRPGVDWSLSGPVALVARLVVIAALAEASYRLVEQPVRNGRFHEWLVARARRAPPSRPRAALVGGATAVVLATALAAAPVATGGEDRSDGPDGLRIAAATTAPRPTVVPATPRRAATTTTSARPTVAVPVDAAPDEPVRQTSAPREGGPTTTAAPSGEPSTAPATEEVTVIGESVTLGAAPELQHHYGERVQIDAVEGRSFEDSVELVEALAEAGRLTPTVIVHIGNNGAAPPGALDRVADAVGEQRRLVLVSVRVPRRWEDQVNGEIHRQVVGSPAVLLADWRQLTHHEDGLLTSDGVHLTRKGRLRYRDLLVDVAR